MSACVSVQVHWKKAIGRLINLGYSEATVQNCDEAQQSIEYLIECIKQLAKERESMIEELETANIKAETLKNAVPNLTKKHHIEQLRVLNKSQWMNNTTVIKKFCQIRRLNSESKNTKVETERLLEERAELVESQQVLTEQWADVSASVSELILKRVESKISVQETTKKKDNVNTNIRDIEKEDEEKEASAYERMQEKNKRRREIEQQCDQWLERLEEQFVITRKAREEYQENQDLLFNKTESHDRYTKIYGHQLNQVTDRQLKNEILVKQVNERKEEIQQLKTKGINAEKEYGNLIDSFNAKMRSKTLENKKMDDSISFHYKQFRKLQQNLKDVKREAEEAEEKLNDFCSIYNKRVSSYNTSIERAQWIADEEDLRSSSQFKAEQKRKVKKMQHEKQVEVLTESISKTSYDLNWESKEKEKLQAEVELTQAEMDEFKEEIESFQEEVVDKLEEVKLERRESVKMFQSLLEITEEIQQGTVSLEADLPLRRVDLEKKKKMLRKEVQRTEKNVNELSKTVESVLEELAIERPYVEELSKSYTNQEIIKQESEIRLKQFEQHHNELCDYRDRYEKNLQDANQRIRALKSDLEDANRRVLAQDRKNYEILHESGVQLTEVLKIEDTLLDENTVFVDSINKEAASIKGLIKTFVRLIRVVTLKPQQIRILQQLLAKLAGCAKEIGSDVNADMEESLQMMRNLEESVLKSIARVDDTVEGLTNQINKFEEVENRTLKAYLSDLAASKISLSTTRSEYERMSVHQMSSLLFPSGMACKDPLPPIKKQTNTNKKKKLSSTKKRKITTTRFKPNRKIPISAS